MPSEPKDDLRLVFPILQVSFQASPPDPPGTAQLGFRTSEGWAYYGVSKGILEDLATRCRRVAAKLPDVPSHLVKRRDLA